MKPYFYFVLAFILNFGTIESIDGPKKVLWFLFDKSQNPDSEFYCPQKHLVTKIEDLCYHFYTFKKTQKSAQEICKKVSHRLVEIDSEKTQQALFESMDKFLFASDIKSFRFHIGAVYNIDSKFYWNNSNFLLDPNLFCQKLSKFSFLLQPKSNMTCLELIHKDPNYKSINGFNTCLKIVDCQSVRYAICEWRGDTIQSYNLELTAQLINSYISLLVVLGLFSFLWIILYRVHKFRVKNISSKACADYLEEMKIFNLRTRD
ncbi:unnamed protein product [Brachionus calyciflorus]|uniref:C-type lectin domain-containing protein n=1 Tax=Brachionus calyciflorus TaxID=104777 RepID=A0A813LZ14_9BILA|nr:unnamed protein product [Brachionus calyciflorus]